MTHNGEMPEWKRIINRHKARILSELEEANCPRAYVENVKRNLNWLRADLEELLAGESG